MLLKKIFRPIEEELFKVEELLKDTLRNNENKFILEITDYLRDAGGKRLRPALVLLSAKAGSIEPKADLSAEAERESKSAKSEDQLIKIASSVELIHIASLVHDDVIDNALLRHHKATINSKWGEDISITLGDYLYSIAFELISQCGSTDILQCISSATKAMCEGEFLQVCERDNPNLLKERYMLIVKKKTAALFASSCHAGSLFSNHSEPFQSAVNGYGLNFGIAFQIIDDYLDLVGSEKSLGKSTGQDIKAGEATLPIIYLLESLPVCEKKKLILLFDSGKNKNSLQEIRSKLLNSSAIDKTKETVFSYIRSAKKRIDIFPHSSYKESLVNLADFIMERGFNSQLS